MKPQLSCLIYRKDLDYLVWNDKANQSGFLYNALKQMYDTVPSYEEWKEVLCGEYSGEFLVQEYLHYNTGEKCILYADSIHNRAGNRINFFIGIPLSEIEKLTQNFSEGTCLLLGTGDHVLAMDAKGITDIPEEAAGWLNREGETVVEGDQYVGIIRQSAQKGFSYGLLILKEDFWSKSRHLRDTFCLILAITLAAAVLIATMLLRRNFRPMSKLLQVTLGNYRKGDEFTQIEEAYCRMKSEKQSMQQKIEKQTDDLRGSYLLSFMKGRKAELSRTEQQFLGLPMEKAAALVSFFVPMSDTKQIQYDELLFFAIDNIFSELMEGYLFYRMEDGPFIFYLFPVEEHQKNHLEERCREAVNTLDSMLRERWGVYIRTDICIGDKKLSEIRFLYQESVENLKKQASKAKESKSIPDLTATEESNRTVKAVIQYIDVNYRDGNLSINAIAEALDRNPKYLSRIFKECTQESILDYITGRRICKAQELMESGGFSTEEVAALVGYVNVQTFRRAFTKVTGMTPGKYAEEQYKKPR